jgi:hypothetical protein
MSYALSNFHDKIAQGAFSNIASWSKIGYNPDIDNAEEDLISQGGTYIWPATAQQMDVVSSSANDTSAGTGVRTITIYYLDGSGVEHTETVTLNGVTPVATVATNIFRINYFRPATVGSGNVAAGNISLTTHGGGNTYMYITAGFTRPRQMCYTVPAGKTLYITTVIVSGVNTSAGHWCRFTARATYDDKAGTVLPANFFMPFNELLVVDQSFQRDLLVPTRMPSGVDLKITAISDAGAANEVCSCATRGYLTTP